MTCGYNLKVNRKECSTRNPAASEQRISFRMWRLGAHSREALRPFFYRAYHQSPWQCQKDRHSENVEVARCLRTKCVYPGKLLDKQTCERFHPMTSSSRFHDTFSAWIPSYAENSLQVARLYFKVFWFFRLIYLCLCRSTTVLVLTQSPFIMSILNNNI